MVTSAPIYRTDYPDSCHIEAVDGMVLIFHRPSGTTHFLDVPLPDLLSLLAEAPGDAHSLCDRLCARLGIERDGEAQAVVDRRLDELAAAGLVWIDRCTV